MNIIPVFCEIDDFCISFEPTWKQKLLVNGDKQRERKSKLCLSEVMTIIVWFHLSGYRTFKDYYTQQIMKHYLWAFPRLVSYNRFVELESSAFVPLCAYLNSRKGNCRGIAYVDSFKLAVCHNKRIHAHKVFENTGARGKTTVGWFYGFKLHLIVNDIGQLLAFRITPGNVNDKTPVPILTKGIYGKLFGDKGYISKELFELLFENGLQLITKVTKKMKNKLLPLMDKILLRKRAIIETIIDQLKNISQIEHSRHRSLVNFAVNVISSLIAYTFHDNWPSLNIRCYDNSNLPVAC